MQVKLGPKLEAALEKHCKGSPGQKAQTVREALATYLDKPELAHEVQMGRPKPK